MDKVPASDRMEPYKEKQFKSEAPPPPPQAIMLPPPTNEPGNQPVPAFQYNYPPPAVQPMQTSAIPCGVPIPRSGIPPPSVVMYSGRNPYPMQVNNGPYGMPPNNPYAMGPYVVTVSAPEQMPVANQEIKDAKGKYTIFLWILTPFILFSGVIHLCFSCYLLCESGEDVHTWVQKRGCYGTMARFCIGISIFFIVVGLIILISGASSKSGGAVAIGIIVIVVHSVAIFVVHKLNFYYQLLYPPPNAS